MTSYPVAVTVFLEVDGMDERDAHNIAEMAVQQALPSNGDTITVDTYTGKQRSARLIEVMGTSDAMLTGTLVVRPAAALYPHGAGYTDND